MSSIGVQRAFNKGRQDFFDGNPMDYDNSWTDVEIDNYIYAYEQASQELEDENTVPVNSIFEIGDDSDPEPLDFND